MAAIARFLGAAAEAPVEDHTGLMGVYDFHLEYKPNLPAAADGAGEIAAPGADLFDAVQAQLGLKLAAKKVPLETLVIDHVEKVPTQN